MKRKTKGILKTMAIIFILALYGVLAMGSGDSNSSSGGSSSRICQFDGCNRKATSAAGEFCDYHSKALNDYWDAAY